jgi:hypothetical protein
VTSFNNSTLVTGVASANCKFRSEIDHERQSVKMLKTLEFQRRICSLDLELEHGSDEDNEITTSSTVEEDDILKRPDLNLRKAAATLLASEHIVNVGFVLFHLFFYLILKQKELCI